MDIFAKTLKQHLKLSRRSRHSIVLLGKVKDQIATKKSCLRDDLCIYAAGSLARLETGRISDLDLFFIANSADVNTRVSRLDQIDVFSNLIQVNETLNLKKFSGDGAFLKVHELRDIISTTGTDIEDSENLFTTRLLLLLESKWLCGEAVHKKAISDVLEMYFRDGRGRKDFRSVFLLNDILRYWRTLCLNYEKNRHQPNKPWWKKNLNLKFPRKLTIYSTVLAIIAKEMKTALEFEVIANLTPQERLAYALDLIGDNSFLNNYKKTLDNYEDFLAAKSHAEIDVNHPEFSQTMQTLSEKAAFFDDFLHSVLESPRLNKTLVRYVTI